MNSQTVTEVLVWTIEGYEGRFLTWDGDSWRAYEYRNYRHWSSGPQGLDSKDLRALRNKFAIPTGALADSQLICSPPSVLSVYSSSPE